MDSIEKLLALRNRKKLTSLDAAITILKPDGEEMKIVNKKNDVKVDLILKDYKFFLRLGDKYFRSVALEYISLDMLELIDVTKMPEKIIVFDVGLPVPF